MSSSLLIYGREALLAHAESTTYLTVVHPKVQVRHLFSGIGFVEGLPPKDAAGLIASLAGVVKVVALFDSGEVARPTTVAEWVRVLGDIATHDRPRVFGVSWYGERRQVPNAREQERIALTLKKQLRESGKHVRWVSGRGQPLTSVQVAKNQLVGDDHAEYLVVVLGRSIRIGRTVAVQDFAEWSVRDYGRPARDARSGMLPPKLARTMVNLLGLSPHAGKLFDPFCGSGTVLTEAAALGWGDLLGSDKSERAVRDTERNLAWTAERHGGRAPHAKIFTSRVEDLRPHVPSASIAAVVTEPYLGPALRRAPSMREVVEIERQLVPLYHAALQEIGRILTPGGRAILVLPRWVLSSKVEHTLPVFPAHLPRSLVLDPLRDVDGKLIEPLLYRRTGQHVGREIVRLRRSSS